jgi:formamidopyrimidine-DNA glycosylase
LSIELPEADILSRQMNTELQGKVIADCSLQGCSKLQKIGFVNRDASEFNRLSGGRINSVLSRGNVILVDLDNDMNLLLAPEYGGKIHYYSKEIDTPSNFHLKIRFTDNTLIAVTLTGMGVIQALKEAELERSYVYKRDFLTAKSPLDDEESTYAYFSETLADKGVNIKAVLVGKDAVVVGLSNSAFQDILYRAKIHPKRKASDLDNTEKHALYDAIKLLIQKRIELGGKDQFTDLYGKQGKYVPAMGPNMKEQACKACGSQVEKLSLGGGQVYFCPKCQH